MENDSVYEIAFQPFEVIIKYYYSKGPVILAETGEQSVYFSNSVYLKR
ncbi:hypothetical protein Q783_01925 [Carnobacterium inhibens subsp. gilichinskyi]|uniref:Uncharacterized protein n=1 Tax=Carnobacterium inhibens subsp. gilichinskyi TaxID=1266845 RepID=U5SC04_9LACT|nr:hypothetical protein Q783_01925 [Carnobacterium inhibens subsp. gilichinskyi]